MMKDQIKAIEFRAGWARVLLLVPVLLALTGMWYGVRWCLGNTIAKWVPEIGAARAAAQLAPADPQTHYTIARLSERSFLPEELTQAAREYEEAARLSPHDYRLFIELGRVRSLLDDARGSEQALRRAVELAPTHPEPRWYLGNLLLRQGRADEAFAELRLAGDANPLKFRPQVLDLAWHVYAGQLPAVLAAVGNSASARAQLLDYLINRQRLDDARRLWAGFDPAQRLEQRALAEKLSVRLLEAKRFHDMLALQQELAAADGTTPAQAEQLLNGGFEAAVSAPGKSWFGWQVVPVAGAQMGFDERVRREGVRSLRLAFDAAGTLNFRNISQLIVVAPQTRYRLAYYVRTEDLRSVSTLVSEIVDAAQPEHVLAAAPPLAPGSGDWQLVTLDFTTGAGGQAVTVRVVSPPCAAAACPIFGKVWYDDFNLQRTDGDANGRRAVGGDSPDQPAAIVRARAR